MSDGLPENQNPLWMPQGSVRSVLALGITGSAIWGVFVLPAESAGLLLALAGVVVTSYFEKRKNGG